MVKNSGSEQAYSGGKNVVNNHVLKHRIVMSFLIRKGNSYTL